MNFILSLQKQYFTHSLRSFVALVHKILFPCNVLFLYGQKDIDKIIDFYSPESNCDGSDLQYNNIRHWLQ